MEMLFFLIPKQRKIKDSCDVSKLWTAIYKFEPCSAHHLERKRNAEAQSARSGTLRVGVGQNSGNRDEENSPRGIASSTMEWG